MKKWRTFSKAQQLWRASSTSPLPTLVVKFNIQQKLTKQRLLHLLFPSANKSVLAENTFFPANFTSVDLPEAKLTASSFHVSDSDVVSVSKLYSRLITVVMLCQLFQFTLTSDAVAPYVYLANLEYDGVFSDNGFLVMPQKTYDIRFMLLGSDKIDINKFQQALKIR